MLFRSTKGSNTEKFTHLIIEPSVLTCDGKTGHEHEDKGGLVKLCLYGQHGKDDACPIDVHYNFG